MLTAVIIMGGIGLIVGVGLAVASKVFYVYVDPKIVAVDEALPGANCGGCGYPGCSANAEAIVAGKSSPNSCVAAGEDVAEIIAGIIGASIEAREPDIARPGCTYSVEEADTKFIYDGISDCRAAALLSGGMKVCTIGCIGLGSCVRACQFGALSMGENGLPVVNAERCTGCGACERACPKHIITLSSVTRRIIKEYTTDDCTTPCQRTCPAGIDICEYIRQIYLGDYHRAVQVIKERLPFPTVIGRICPRPCEFDCRRGLADEPVAINFLKRFVADYEKERGERVQPYKAPATGHRVAVIGGGVEGLSTAFFTARLGHSPTVFEATDKLGGLLRKAIAFERLPREILDWDIEGVLEMGVEAKTGTALGKDVTIASLLGDGYECVYLAAGGWDSRLARGVTAADEQPVPGTFLLMDLVKSAQSPEDEAIDCSGNVLIAGGGRLAASAVAICRQRGAGNITLLFRETEADSPLEAAQVEKLRAEGVTVTFGHGVFGLSGQQDQLKEVEIVDLTTREKETLPVDRLFLSSGRLPELIFTRPRQEEDQPETEGPLTWITIEPYKKPAYSMEIGLLAEGDELSDYSAAVRAIGGGRRSAASIHQAINGIDLDLPRNVLTPDRYIQNIDHVEGIDPAPRQIMPLCTEPDCKELELGFTEEMAKTESARCLQCGLICYKEQPPPAQIQAQPPAPQVEQETAAAPAEA